MQILLSITIPLVLSVAHYLGNRKDIQKKSNISLLQSFAAGFSIAYVFLLLIPEISILGQGVEYEAFYLTLLGFIFFHFSHRIFIKANKKEHTDLSDYLHLITLGVYNFLITFSLIEIIINNFIQGFLTLILVTAHAVLSEIAYTSQHREKISNLRLPFIYIFTALAGLISLLSATNLTLNYVLFALSAGAIIYISIREEIPPEKQSHPLYFLSGNMLFVLLIFMTI